jgi:hypothetical protein
MGNDLLKIVEEYIVSLLGSEEKACPTIWHLQKELFIFTKINPKAGQLFNFVRHYEGPYSQIVQESLKDPMYYEDAFVTKQSGEICLSYEGKRNFEDLKNRYTHDTKFIRLLNSFKLIRDIYDRLTKEELLFLVYVTYPEYVEYSNIYDRLVKNKQKRMQLSENLFKKGLITTDRYKELIACVAE